MNQETRAFSNGELWSLNGTFTLSFGQWTAGQAWSNFIVPCNCQLGICYNTCIVGSEPVHWDEITAESACDPRSKVFQKWASPLGYCSFPVGTNTSAVDIATLSTPRGAYGVEYFGSPPTGAQFNVPGPISAMQGLTIISTITCFLSALFGVIDALPETPLAGFLDVFAWIFSLLTWVFALAALTEWTQINFVKGVRDTPHQVWVPFWVNRSANFLSAVEVSSVRWGPAWASITSGCCLMFLVNLCHVVTLRRFCRRNAPKPGQKEAPPSMPTSPSVTSPPPAIPAMAVPVAEGTVNVV